MNEWLAARADELAADGTVPRELLELSNGDVETLLDLAGLAAHASGARLNAPLLCYLLGVARASGRSLDELAAAVRASTS